MIVLLVIEYILAICLILIMLIFFVPIFFNIQVSKYHGLILWVKVSWLFNAFYCYIEKRGDQKPVAIVRILGIKIPIERGRTPQKKKGKSDQSQIGRNGKKRG